MKPIYQIPFRSNSATSFNHNGKRFKMSAPRFNKIIKAFFVDISWDGGEVNGVCLSSGTNILIPFNTPLPNIFVYNKKDSATDVTDLDSLVMFIIGEVKG